VVALLLIVPGVLVLLDAFVRFARASGTPAPIAPTRHLVVVGPYRYVRNPMYLAVVAIILGQAILFGSWGVMLWAIAVAAAVALFVYTYEQPTLERDYGDEYARYRANVRAWVPRLRPWNGA
jgi:protein-S-isoprenylcysteine O-methyltransferase Ste14